MTDIYFLCDHGYYCANSLFCELNGGDCKYTGQQKHSRNGVHITDIHTDIRFEKVVQCIDPLAYAYYEKENI